MLVKFTNNLPGLRIIAMYEESKKRRNTDDDVVDGTLPPYLLDRETTTRVKILSNTIKQKRKENAGKWEVPLPKVRPVAEDEMFKVVRTGKKKMELGPGISGNIFDGIQRPLKTIARLFMGVYIPCGIVVPTLDKDILWEFQPKKLANRPHLKTVCCNIT